MTLVLKAFTQPRTVAWWQWGQILGVILLPVLLCHPSPLVAALIMHVFCDFTIQISQMVPKRGIWLVIHSLIAGAVPGFVAAGLTGAIGAFVVHILVDYTRKLELPEPIGVIIDQGIHVWTLVLLCI